MRLYAPVPASFLATLALALSLPGAGAAGAATPAGDARPATAARCPDSFAPAGRVASVDEGGDLVLSDGGVLRLAGLSLAGTQQGPALRAALTELAVGREVEIAPAAGRDRYARQPSLVRRAGEATTLQERLLARGLAVARPEAGLLGCMAGWYAAEDTARRARRGVWRELPLRTRDVAAIGARQGRFTIVEGRVLSVGNTRTLHYLNFGPVWRQDMTGRLTQAGHAALEAAGMPATDLAGRHVTLRGTVFEAGGPAMELVWAEQIGWTGRAERAGTPGTVTGGADSGDAGARQAGDE
ncbi:thermonuclease family protein [Ancylobacter sp. TS-1]|uniref:thermonuclease family protein n=1 Tax=Ancylobacter sp. TS-1 TaxID=1850374 RepID=UPI001265B7E1|nr:nuclease [Ancylobacter sp. TS-1]QFR33801.1 nuclease [Ancylobacter sp. TS-1]